MKALAAIALALLLGGCGTLVRHEEAPVAPAPAPSTRPAPPAAAAPGKGAYYKDDGPGTNPPPDLAAIPDAVPRAEPLNRYANRPYEAFGKTYVPLARLQPFREVGVGSWYGRRFQGGRTSSGEPYDMYAMTAAHPTLPIPSYARVTNLANGRSVVVRINDRGPFLSDRVIDLSYAAAWKLGYVEAGSSRVEVDSILPGSEAPVQVASAEQAPPPASAPKPTLQAVPAPAPPPPAADAEPQGIYLQLGAFSARESAESFRARVYRELAWLQDAIHVVAGGALYRLHLGPYRSPGEARSVADRIAAELNLRPLVVVK